MLESLRKSLDERGFVVMTSAYWVTGLKIAMTYELESIVLEFGLPRLDGNAPLRWAMCMPPVLMLPVSDTEDDLIHEQEVGAADYLTKPLSFSELVARRLTLGMGQLNLFKS